LGGRGKGERGETPNSGKKRVEPLGVEKLKANDWGDFRNRKREKIHHGQAYLA